MLALETPSSFSHFFLLIVSFARVNLNGYGIPLVSFISPISLAYDRSEMSLLFRSFAEYWIFRLSHFNLMCTIAALIFTLSLKSGMKMKPNIGINASAVKTDCFIETASSIITLKLERNGRLVQSISTSLKRCLT